MIATTALHTIFRSAPRVGRIAELVRNRDEGPRIRYAGLETGAPGGAYSALLLAVYATVIAADRHSTVQLEMTSVIAMETKAVRV
jgi:hypothetical protein